MAAKKTTKNAPKVVHHHDHKHTHHDTHHHHGSPMKGKGHKGHRTRKGGK